MTGPSRRLGRKRPRVHTTKKQKLDEVRNEINVTPLVDVCLVLLIVFMVISELLARGKEVPLPQTEHHETEKDENQPIVAIDLKRKLYFGKDEVSDLEMLKKRVEDDWRASGQSEQRVFVKADIHLPYGDVYPVIMAMHDLGVAGIDLGTNEKKEKK